MPGALASTTKIVMPFSGLRVDFVLATHSRQSATLASGTNSLVPLMTYSPSRAVAVVSTDLASYLALASVKARVSFRSPEATFGSMSFFWASLPAARTVKPPRITVEKNGPG